MPRKKVAPDDRVRAAKACRPCRQRKKKCDGACPCTNCIKRAIPEQCDLNEVATPSARNRTASVTTQAIPDPLSAGHGEGQGSEQHSSYAHISSDGSSPEVPVRTNPRMLSNARGERVFIGEHASLSFLQLMRDIVHTSIGASEFSHEPRQDFMLEADFDDSQELDLDFFTDSQIEARVNTYLLATNGLIDLFDRPEAMSMVRTLTTTGTVNDSALTAIAYLILAIGAQSTHDENYSHKEHVLFALGRKAAFHNFLEDPGVTTVQLFLLCAFYMFGACRRNAAYMYLGVATRAAHAIGLHNHLTYDSLSPDEVKRRSRLWRSLFSLDVIACSILGRPTASMTVKTIPVQENSDNPITDSQSHLALSSVCKLARIVEDVSTNLYGRKTLQVEDAERQLDVIQSWRRTLPNVLRANAPLSSQTTEVHRTTIGSLHISCFHQFSILLVTRPFLVPVLMKRIAIQQQSPLASTSFMNDIDEARASRLAHTCVNVAIDMAQTCWNVYDHGLMLGNMCILKAWIFSASLVIGFHLFATIESDSEAETAFSQAQSILHYLAARSPQAKHYRDILVYLHDAIKKRHQQRATPSRKQNAFLIDQIMTLGAQTDSNLGHVNLSNGLSNNVFPNAGTSGSNSGAPNIDSETWLNNIPIDDGEMQLFLQSSEFGWNAAMMPFWNQFSFDV